MHSTGQSAQHALSNHVRLCGLGLENSWSVWFGHQNSSWWPRMDIQVGAAPQHYFSRPPRRYVEKSRHQIISTRHWLGLKAFWRIRKSFPNLPVHTMKAKVFSSHLSIFFEKGKPYPKEFEKNLLRPIFSLLYHVLAHIYEFHFQPIVELTQESHLNAITCHFLAFSKEFGLLQAVNTEALEALAKVYFAEPKASLSGAPLSANLAIRKLSSEQSNPP